MKLLTLCLLLNYSSAFWLPAKPCSTFSPPPSKTLPRLAATTEYIALLPGTPMNVLVGSKAQARKAWKKRRRSGSPILVPCSILDVGYTTGLRQSIMYLVMKYGATVKSGSTIPGFGDRSGARGLALGVSALRRLYEKEFGSDLKDHAMALLLSSDDSNNNTASEQSSLIAELMDLLFQKDKNMGIEFVQDSVNENRYWLVSALSKGRARSQAALTGSAQVEKIISDENEGAVVFHHTGFVRVQTSDDDYESRLEPLSAAVRIPSQGELENLTENQIMRAFVFGFDEDGDDGSPLMTVSTDYTKGQSQDWLKRKERAKKQKSAREHNLDANSYIGPVTRSLDDLKAGDGPFKARISVISGKSGALFVDLGVGRRRSKAKGGGKMSVLGMLRFDELVELAENQGLMDKDDENESVFSFDDDDEDIQSINDLGSSFVFAEDDDEYGDEDEIDALDDDDDDDDEEEKFESVENVSDLFQVSEDGSSLYSIDPETGERAFLGSIDGDDDDNEDTAEEDHDEDEFAGMSSKERLEAISKMLDDPDDDLAPVDEHILAEEPFRIRNSPLAFALGEEIDVYIKTVSKQSGRFMVTLDPSKCESKKDRQVDKRMARLEEQYGEDGVRRMLELEGIESEAVVKAVSKTGDWFYVKPGGEFEDLPVGVCLSEVVETALSPGDRIRVRFEGIDGSRGQLAMRLVCKE